MMENIRFPTFNLNRAFTAILALQMGLAPLCARASEPAKISPPSLHIEEHDRKVLIRAGDEQSAVMEIPYGDEARIRASSPARLALNLGNEMKKIKSASGGAWSHSTRNLPAESGVFFLAMGAVVAGQVLLDDSRNPIALQEYLNHQLSPIGAASFFAFMYSQGVTSNVLSLYLRHPALRSMIPYLGMSVGAFVQSGLAQFASDPDVWTCAQSWTPKKADPKSCERAYERYAVKRQIWQAAPGIASMLTSSVISSVGQTVLRQGLLRLSGLDLATFLMPGGLEVKGVRLLLVKGLQIGAFVAIDSWLSGKINFAWKNAFDGREFDRLDRALDQETDPKKRRALLKEFHERSVEWRALNLADVYEAHQAWSENLQRLTGMYNASYQFYSSLLNEIHSAAVNPQAPLNRISPLNGITAKGLQKQDADLYLTDPVFVEPLQLATVQDVVRDMDQKFARDAYTREGVTPLTQKELKILRDQLATGDRVTIGTALARVHRLVFREHGNTLNDAELILELQKIYRQLGAPDPAFEKGRGFVTAYAIAPTSAAVLKDVPFYRRVGAFKTATLTDYLVASMICGPDVEKNEKAIYMATGFPGVFTPPQIREPGLALNSLCQAIPTGDGLSPYRAQIPATGSADALDFLKSHTRASVLGKEEDGLFQTWWETHTEAQMKKAFDIYARSYVKITARLVQGIFREEQSGFNTGSMANGTVSSIIQEAHVYEARLNEIMNAPAGMGGLIKVNDFTSAGAALMRSTPQQLAFENKLGEIIGLLKRIAVVTDKNGELALNTDLKPDEIAQKKMETQALLDQWKAALTALNLSPAEHETANLCFENLRTLTEELGFYGQIARAVSRWDEIKDNTASTEEQDFRNRVMDKMRKVKNSIWPFQN